MRYGTKTQFARQTAGGRRYYLSGFLIKLGIGFLADVWVGLVIIAAALCLGVAGYRIYKFWRDTRP